MKPKVQVIARREADFARATKTDGLKILKNTAPELHPLSQQIEYVRAVRAAKMKKMFSKPFIGSLEGHSDTITALSRDHREGDIPTLVSGSVDGDIRIWDLSARECLHTFHAGSCVNDVCSDHKSELVLGVSANAHIYGFRVDSDSDDKVHFDYTSPHGHLSSIDFSYANDQFVTAGEALMLWSPHRNQPILKFSSQIRQFTDSVFNQNEQNLICACAEDRSIIIADTRTSTIARTITMKTKSNAVDWNPQKPFYFVVANDDSACYLFDVRKTESAIRVFTDHLGPVTCINFSPNGNEFVSGSYDRTVRVWDWSQIKSLDCYHTKRMQRVFSCCISHDSKFVITGSEDMSIRLFKTKANEVLTARSKKEEEAQNMNERLLKKWRHSTEVKMIAEKQNLPKTLHRQRYERAKQMDAVSRKALARMAHSKDPESMKPKPLRIGRIVDDNGREEQKQEEQEE